MKERPLAKLGLDIPWAELGEFPTPIETLIDERVWVKRDDISSQIYGGNKVRTLEPLFAAALARGAERIYATGAFGSNHAIATALHAERIGLQSGAILFAQPFSEAAAENLNAVASIADDVVALPHWSALPLGMAYVAARDRRRGIRSEQMAPGGATVIGALGYVSAAFEVCEQVQRGEMPAPKEIVLPIGSTCTSAGLLVGMLAAAKLGRIAHPPRIHSVRVSPWPVTSKTRVVDLAHRTGRYLAAKLGHRSFAIGWRELSSKLVVDGSQIGKGYGIPTEAGRVAIERFQDRLRLDTTYSAKAAAALAGEDVRDVLYWATKSSAPLPSGKPKPTTPRAIEGWLANRG